MRLAALILQTICIIFTASGIGFQYLKDADLGLLLITAGSFIFAISVKITKTRLIRTIKDLQQTIKEQKDESNLCAGMPGIPDNLKGAGRKSDRRP